MAKKKFLDKFHTRANTRVVESFLTLVMIGICAGIIYTFYLASVSQELTQLNIIIILQLIQTIILVALIYTGIKIWEIHEFPEIKKKK